MTRTALLTTLLTLGACTTESSGGFSATGDYNVNNELGEDLSGDIDDDNNGSDTGSANADAPIIEYATAEFETSTGAVLLTVGFTDPQGDVDAGVMICQFEVDGGNSKDCLGSDGNQIPIDGKYARVDEDADGIAIVESRLSLTVDGDAYYFELALVDTEGNRSETIGVNAK